MTCIRCAHGKARKHGYFGKTRIQRWRCISCHATFAEPRQKIGTHYLRMEKAAQVVSMMLEGMSIRAISRLTNVDRNTILSLLETAGEHCCKLWDAKVRNMRSDFVQADEIWTFVGCHQRRLQPGAPAEWGDAYVWIALDSTTKMVISYYVGKRDRESAHEFLRDFSQRIEGRFQLTTDGLKWYIPAVEKYLSGQVDFAQLIKMYSSHDISGPEWYGTASRVVGTYQSVQDGRPDPRYISTSHIERSNLTLRMQLRRFTRLTNAHSRKLANLKHAIALYMAWYCFCRPHQTLRCTPAMESQLATHIWTVEELLSWQQQ